MSRSPSKGALAGAALCALTIACLYPTTALCFCLQPNPPRVCTEFFSADVVFTGKVTSVRYVPQGLPGQDPGWLYHLNVLKMYRGPARSSIKVYTENNSARFRLKKGQTYLLFAYRSGDVLEIYGCGNSCRLGQADATLKQIREVLRGEKTKSGGSIGGQVEPSSGESTDMAGIRLQAKSGSRTYHTLTCKDGSFDIHVPSGKYTLRAEARRWKIAPYDLSFSRPDDLVIHDGGCADVILLATPKAAAHP